MACRVPGADNWLSYWENLEKGIESVELVDKSNSQIWGTNLENFVGAKVVLQNKELFDAGFFDYRPAEATLMNPMHRLFHECVWEALEDAGYDPFQSRSLIGLYAGGNENLNWKLYSQFKNKNHDIDEYTLDYLNSRDYVASLIAYKLNLKGPVVSVNTACSTSLVTVNMAYKSLLLGEADLALAGGISIVTQPQQGYFFEEGMIASRDGHCKAFDKLSSGTLRGEGAGVVVLKRLQEAIRDGDNIHAIIKGAAINNDGKQKVGFTAPAVEGQAECIKRALKFAKVTADTISYIETHGTGTRLGDVIEIEALNIAFGHNTNHTCAIGSVKTNLGHLDTAAGIAGFIKTVLSLKHKKIPATLHFKEPNPDIAFDKGPFYVNATLTDWNSNNGIPRRAGVSSFGIGGTNAHVILEEAPERQVVQENSKYQLLVLSACSENSLNRYLETLRAFLLKEPALTLSDLCFTMREGRRHFEFRKSFAVSSKEDLLQLLSIKLPEGSTEAVAGKIPKVVFLFPGQGSQYLNMGRGLYEENDYFRKIIDEGLEELQALTGEDWKRVMYSNNSCDDSINNTRYTQPLLFLFEYALAKFLIASGVAPDYLIGHSIGEYTAAAISGVFGFFDALKIVNRRAEILSGVKDGLMLSANMGEDAASSWLTADISLAAVNAPNQVVFSGTASSIKFLAGKLEQHEIPYAFLKTTHAFHSYMLDPVLDDFSQVFDSVKLNLPAIPFISNITGKLIEADDAVSARYWVLHLRSTVRFSDGLNNLAGNCERLKFIEVGPGKILTNLINDHKISNQAGLPTPLTRNIYNEHTDCKYVIQQIGKLWEAGASIEWPVLLNAAAGRRVSLPTYCFDRSPYPTEVRSIAEQLEVRAAFTGGDLQAPPSCVNQLYYSSWTRSIVKNGRGESSTFLYWSTGDDFARKLIATMEQDGHRVVEIVAADNYSKVSKYQYYIRPAVESDYITAFDEMGKDGIPVTDVIYSWAIQAKEGGHLTGDDTQLNLLYFGIIYCVRNLSKYWDPRQFRFITLTRSLHRVLGTEESQTQQSITVGLLPSVGAEFGINCRTIDFISAKNEIGFLTMLAREISAYEEPENCTALRYGQRWTRTFKLLTKGSQAETSVLRQNGMYVITGGLGNVGFCLAKYLLKNYNARIILTGRKDIANDNSDREKVKRLQELNQLSSRVSYYNVDISDADAVKKMAEDLEREYGAVNGIVHAAGVLDNQYFDFINNMSPVNTRILFASKICGIENIYEAFRNRKLDFVWVTSSISGVVGGLGFGAYAAANSFIDFFIAANNEELKNWTSVAFSELSVTENERSNRPQALGSKEFCEIFNYTVGLGVAPVLFQSKEGLQVSPVVSPEERVITHKEISRSRKVANEYMVPATETEKKLTAIFEVFFGIETVGVNDNFFDLGGDSLKGMILLKKTNSAFEVNLQLVDFLKNPDICSLALKIDQLIWFRSDNPMKYEMII